MLDRGFPKSAYLHSTYFVNRHTSISNTSWEKHASWTQPICLTRARTPVQKKKHRWGFRKSTNWHNYMWMETWTWSLLLGRTPCCPHNECELEHNIPRPWVEPYLAIDIRFGNLHPISTLYFVVSLLPIANGWSATSLLFLVLIYRIVLSTKSSSIFCNCKLKKTLDLLCSRVNQSVLSNGAFALLC
jgi:hypothetical protein